MKKCLILLSFLFASVTVNASVADYNYLKAKVLPGISQEQAAEVMAECNKAGHITAEACSPIMKKKARCIFMPDGHKVCVSA